MTGASRCLWVLPADDQPSDAASLCVHQVYTEIRSTQMLLAAILQPQICFWPVLKPGPSQEGHSGRRGLESRSAMLCRQMWIMVETAGRCQKHV